MASMSVIALCVVCATQSAPASQTMARWQPIVAEAATRFALPANWIVRVMQAESGGKTMLNGQPITSAAGAMGLMQVMPDTYAAMRQNYHLGADPYDPHDNILAGAAFLRAMYDRYGYPDLFAAYNAGPGRFEDFLYRHRPLPAETRAYVARILADNSPPFETSNRTVNSTLAAEKFASSRDLFFVREGQPTSANSPPALPTNSGTLFVPLSPPVR